MMFKGQNQVQVYKTAVQLLAEYSFDLVYLFIA